MVKKILVISATLRKSGNSDALARAFAEGAKAAGNEVEFISLRGKTINFCVGCLSCQNTQKCVIKDDAPAIVEKMHDSDVIAFATPVYYYEMSGQMKTLLDRATRSSPPTTSSGTSTCSPPPPKTTTLPLTGQSTDSAGGLPASKSARSRESCAESARRESATFPKKSSPKPAKWVAKRKPPTRAFVHPLAQDERTMRTRRAIDKKKPPEQRLFSFPQAQNYPTDKTLPLSSSSLWVKHFGRRVS